MRIHKSFKDAISLKKSNSNTIWWEVIVQDMKNVRISFEIYEGTMEDIPPGYQEVSCHIIFDVKVGENFLHKSQMVSGGHKNTTPSLLNYLLVVSQDSLRTAFKISALNYLKGIACNI